MCEASADCFRGETTTFIPKAIWLVLTTPQQRVNEDLEAVMRWAATQEQVKSGGPVGVLGFCFGGGKAIGYTTQARADAATVVYYGTPVTEVGPLKVLRAAALPSVASSGRTIRSQQPTWQRRTASGLRWTTRASSTR